MITQENFLQYAETIQDDLLQSYVDSLESLKGKNISYLKKTWGHTFSVIRRFGTYLQYGYGFNRNREIKVGDNILLETDTDKIGKFLVLHIEYQSDPRDLFYAYVVCNGYENL